MVWRGRVFHGKFRFAGAGRVMVGWGNVGHGYRNYPFHLGVTLVQLAEVRHGSLGLVTVRSVGAWFGGARSGSTSQGESWLGKPWRGEIGRGYLVSFKISLPSGEASSAQALYGVVM